MRTGRVRGDASERCDRAPSGQWWLESLEGRTMLAAAPVGWTPLVNAPPGGPSAVFQLTDGSVLIEYSAGGGGNASKTWARLTPSSTGSYINGTWSILASANISRLDFASVMLRDGRIFTAGGEYGAAGAFDPTCDQSEIYDPLRNAWTLTSLETLGRIADAMTVTLPNGDILVGPVTPNTPGATMIYHVASDTWTEGPKNLVGKSTNEETWVKLKDDTVLTARNDRATSERYVPWLNKWIADAPVPVSLFDSLLEVGGAMLLADGRVFYQGGNGNNALYTPSNTLAPGTWAIGPTMPVVAGKQLGADDAPICMMPDGRILMAVGPANGYTSPTYFYAFDPANNTVSAVAGAPNINDPVFGALLMNLPDGTILYTTRFGNGQTVPRAYVYNPGVAPLAGAKPTISDVTNNGNGTYTLTGTKLNGINEGNSYGDDQQQDTNFPLVRLTSGANVSYARTFNFSSVGVATGNLAGTTQFVLPPGIAPGTYSLQVVSNGFASDAQPFTISTVGNATPTVSTPAAAAPSPVVSGTTTALSVLGADDGGAAKLTYTWVTTASPAGFQLPSFSANGSNASRNTTATFYKKGTYTFQVFIADAGGLSTSSTVTVNVTSAALPAATPDGGTGGTPRPSVVKAREPKVAMRPVLAARPAAQASPFAASASKRRLIDEVLK